MRLPTLAISAIIGISPLLWLPELPPIIVINCLIVGALLLGVAPGRVAKFAAITLLFFCWGVLDGQQLILPANQFSGKQLAAEVEITAIEGEGKYAAKLISINGHRPLRAAGILLYGDNLPVMPCAGQRWQMTLRVRAVHGQLNEGGFDSQQNALARHRPLTGQIVQAAAISERCTLRARIIRSLAKSLDGYSWQAVMLALATGEKTALSAETKLLLQQTGTAHLLAISGLHVSLVALLGGMVVRALQYCFPCRWIAWQAPLAGGFLLASVYAWLSGFQLPAERTLIAAGCWLCLRFSGRRWSAWAIWLCCIAGILLWDPIAVLAQSFWLSAFAVAALIFWYRWGPTIRAPNAKLLQAVWRLLHLQMGLLMLLLPLQVQIFHGFSWISIPANLVAIPLVTLAEIPLLLAGMLLHCLGWGAVEQGVWTLANGVLATLFWFLQKLPEGWVTLDTRVQWLTLLPWIGLVVWRLLGWRTYPVVVMAGGILLAYPLWRREAPENWSLTMLDVGQGLSVVIARHGKALLYDTGLAWPGGDSAQQLIIPWLRWHHLQPEGVILSHEHLDHRGGLETLKKVWPNLWIKSSLEWKGHQPCFRGEAWEWQGLTFQAIWPLAGSTEKGNNRSCVVRVDDGHFSALLTGDIETPAEMLMLSHYWQHLASTLVQVPHHGSATSSSSALLRRVEGKVALSSAARYNAWHFPSRKVKDRYQQQKYQWFDTARQGQITVSITSQGWKIQSLRDQIFPRWYHPWFGDTHDNG
ncbi:ComEC family protein [Enterobacteriaceae bacterium RIT691]|nr:ComEC family protein [Enterobacteriaceae bacterium RIT691]